MEEVEERNKKAIISAPSAVEVKPEKAVLDPDHPLLAKFQQALKEHYLNQIARLKDEIFELETDTKKKNVERDELGVQTYEAQQLVCKQQKILEILVTNVQTVSAAREEVENQVKAEKQQLREMQDSLVASEKNSLELQNELNSVNLLTNQLADWESKIESNITVNQRISEKTRKDNMMLTEEKRMQDVIIYRLMNITWKLESDIETLNIQIRLKENDILELDQTITLGNTNVEALQAEHRCLMHSWNSVIVAISSRDKLLDCLTTKGQKLKEDIKSVMCEIEQIKKLTKLEMMKNEAATMNKARMEYDIQKCTTQYEIEVARYNELERQMCELQMIIQQTERDLAAIVAENHHKEGALAVLDKDYARIFSKKTMLEDRLLKNLGDQKNIDKVAAGLCKTLDAAKETKKDTEIRMCEADNKLSYMNAELESQKYRNDEHKRLLEEVGAQHTELSKQADNLRNQIEKNELLFKKKEGQVTVLNNKLEKLLEKTGQNITISPQELKIITLEKQIQETQEKIKSLQTFWLREQRNLLNVSKERQEQIHKVNLMRKQLLILQQKNLKVSYELEQQKKEETKITISINTLHNKLVILCNHLFRKRGRKQELDQKNYYLQTQYDGKLKDCDLERLRIQQEIIDYENDKEGLSKELVDLNREALEWEKKTQLAKETRNNMKEERSRGGDIDNMKQEIQKMTVIYGQLRRAQDKLLKDFEHSISRRDAIYTIAEAKQKKSSEDRTRINYTRRMDDTRNKIKQLETEYKEIQAKIEELEAEKIQTNKEIQELHEKIKFYEDSSVNLIGNIEKNKTDRQLKFELLLLVQKKVRLLGEIVAGRSPYVVYKKEDHLVEEYNKQKELNNKLGNIIQNLTVDFPNYSTEFIRVYNTLKVHVLAVNP